MRRLDDERLIEAVLRDPAFVDRAPLERALSARFFAPFSHQEVVHGARFEARSRWSRAVLAQVPPARAVEAAARAFAAYSPRATDSLLETVRACVAQATTALVLGDTALLPTVLTAVRDIDRAIKMIGRADLCAREPLRAALTELLARPGDWPRGSYLELRREQALALPLSERVDHVAAVFLATGIIQVSDTVTHALLALDQHPEARGAGDEAVITATVRSFPVNASMTRSAAQDVTVEGHRFRRGEAISIVPARLALARRFDVSDASRSALAFGAGARGCPASRVASALAAALLGHYRAVGVRLEPDYRHRRSLALAVRASFGDAPPPARTPSARRARELARYAVICAESYPAAFFSAMPELWREVTA